MASLRMTPVDDFITHTSTLQAETEEILRKHIPVDGTPYPTLHKDQHLQFLLRSLVQGFPVRYTSQDASQPWLLYWTVQGFAALQVELDPLSKQRVIDKVMTWQHPDGGFGGGPGQSAHLLPTYASVCILSIVGRPGPGGGWDQIDREKLHSFFMSLKQSDGSFLVTHHAEVDMRGIYCLLVAANLLNIITPELLDGLPSFISSCQTYEGGFSSASQPYFSAEPDEDAPPTLLTSPRPPLGEAHGGYTFCGLASWVMLQPYLKIYENKLEVAKASINTRTLLRWLVQMQGSEVELGGFRGRTNKLVDGCYSWWVGGAFALLEVLGVPSVGRHVNAGEGTANSGADEWDDVDDSLFNRKALQKYIIYAGQHPAGGLRDKPPKSADAYHTLSCLSGLSSAQHYVYPSSSQRMRISEAWKASDSDDDRLEELHKQAFMEALSWTEEEGAATYIGGQGNKINATHPVFNLTITHTQNIMSHFYKQSVPRSK